MSPGCTMREQSHFGYLTLAKCKNFGFCPPRGDVLLTPLISILFNNAPGLPGQSLCTAEHEEFPSGPEIQVANAQLHGPVSVTEDRVSSALLWGLLSPCFAFPASPHVTTHEGKQIPLLGPRSVSTGQVSLSLGGA